MPDNNPMNFGIVNVSSCSVKCASTIVQSGIVAFKTPASPESILVSAKPIKLIGVATLVIPKKNGSQNSLPDHLISNFCHLTIIQVMARPKMSRQLTIVIGPISRKASLIHKNDVAQAKQPKYKNTSHCLKKSPLCPLARLPYKPSGISYKITRFFPLCNSAFEIPYTTHPAGPVCWMLGTSCTI